MEIRDAASRFCSILAHLFGESLDRLTLWTKIGTALETAAAKIADDDLDGFVALCLESVKADSAKTAACGPLSSMLDIFLVRTPEWRREFIAYVASHRLVVVVRGRQRWELYKGKKIEL